MQNKLTKLLNNKTLFWDIYPEQIDLKNNANFIIYRILEFGSMNDVKLCFSFYGKEKIKELLLSNYRRRFSAKTLNFWKIIFNIEEKEWKKYTRLPNNEKESKPRKTRKDAKDLKKLKIFYW